MKTLIIFDSTYGNTRKIAEAIAAEMGKDAKAVFISNLDKKELAKAELIIVGSPILGWRPSEKTAMFLESFGKDGLKGKKAASFDTRMKIFFHGDATKKISEKLKEAGATIIAEPNFFYVKGKEGPLLDGELERAKEWATSIKNKD